MNTLVIITGPTAVGKTELCLDIARRYNIPIINADSRQMFRGMQIGTAAPTPDQQKDVRHYFVGHLQLEDYYNAALYEFDVINLLEELFDKNNQKLQRATGNAIELLTGGSMMYIDAVCNGIDEIPTINSNIRNLLKERFEREGLENLCNDLMQLDPEYYGIVDKKNPRRVIHGLEICLQTGKSYSSFRKNKSKTRNFNIKKIILDRPREELYNRINARVDQMIKSGLVDEAKALYTYRRLNALNTVGYKELFEYIDGNCTLDEAIERIKSNTRKYARKQLTWFKRYQDAKWFHPDDKDTIMKYISQYE